MPLASNPLLQSASVARPQSVGASSPDKVADAGKDKASGFAEVYAQQSEGKPAAVKDAPGTAARDKVADRSSGDTDEQGIAAEQSGVAAGGNALPADAVQAVADDLACITEPGVVDGDPASVLLDAQLLQAATVTPPAAPAALAATVQAPTQEQVQPAFDPSSDPLADLPVVRLALEQSAQALGTTSAHAASQSADAGQPEAMPGQGTVNGLAAMLDKQAADSTGAEPGEQSFSGLLDDGLKDLKGASSDTRVDNFADRLAALTQAATPKSANAVPVAAPLNQPLAMHQGGWTEGLVNRVMYLSSQSLKSADIQLEPAELGRLDIRVNLTADQPAQVAFSSGHAGVREALEGQVHRLKDMFAEQGLGRLDVSVSDQSRGQEQGREASRGGASSARRADGGEPVEGVDAVAQADTPSVVLGSSAVDYYA
ncbi:flagellar hook-length control protein FliK [Pseudomonas sp. LS1212]|uniref:flagellar hook-length control protein FliK n=1 Tax=Pseudomonas sp. LS1212 TaxID=2972478 RepID=UPI00215CAC2A|nr:flagellar hook-length control protein FliK [Pseudomonas sp. LS1212]UVJ45442.1 flagellar hook-length control protein FliK [Pseudomonas sp. LS1212]